jgi:hypothetical protein
MYPNNNRAPRKKRYELRTDPDYINVNLVSSKTAVSTHTPYRTLFFNGTQLAGWRRKSTRLLSYPTSERKILVAGILKREYA